MKTDINGHPAKSAKKPKRLTLRQKVDLLNCLVLDMRRARYHFPNSDFYEYCAGCGRSPHYVPAHTETCLVVRVHRTLKLVNDKPCKVCNDTDGNHTSWCNNKLTTIAV